MYYSIEVKADDGQFIEMLQGEDINSLLTRAIELKTKGFLGYYYEKKKLKAAVGKELADQVNRDLHAQHEKETSLFEFSRNNKIKVNWDHLIKDFEDNNPEPVSENTVAEPVFEKIPPEPKIDDSYYQFKFNIKDGLIPFRKQKIIEELKKEFEKDYRKWEKQKERIEARNRVRYDEYLEMQNKLAGKNNLKYHEWEKIRNGVLEEIKNYETSYANLNAESVEKYCELIVSRSDFRGMKISRKPALRYVAENKFLFIEFPLPYKEDLIKIKSITYDADGEQFLEVEFKDSELEARYVKVLENVAFKIIHEFLSLDSANALNEINFRGVVKKTDRITGRNDNIPVLSLSVNKSEFMSLNLTGESLHSLFKQLGGIYTNHHLVKEPSLAENSKTFQYAVQ